MRPGEAAAELEPEVEAEPADLVLWEALEAEPERMLDGVSRDVEEASGAFAGFKSRMVRSEDPVRT